MNMTIRQSYQLLGLQEGSPQSAVREAYQRLALAYHPDRNPGAGDVFSQISAAYQALNEHFARLIADNPDYTGKELDISRERRTRRGKPSDRRFEIVLEASYLGTSIRERI